MLKLNKAKTSSDCKLQRLLLYHQSVDYRLSTVQFQKNENLDLSETLVINDRNRFKY